MIYIVEDDAGIRDMMTYTLNSTGFQATGFAESTAFWQAMAEKEPELIILDIMLPGQSGTAILAQLRGRSATKNIPVIMATAKGAEYDKVSGLDMGADDYLVKPFGMMEMVSRIKAVLRRCAPAAEDNEYICGRLTLDDFRHQVTADGQNVILTLKEYEMLLLFMKNPGRVFTRDNLLENIWEMEYDGLTRTVDVHIRTLRRKLAGCGKYIQTVRGLGYRLEAGAQ